MRSQADRLARVAALGEPRRRDIYLFVAAASDPVSRDQVAERFGVSRGVAAFHLDKLAELGLLDTEFHRPLGRGGPGAGRPAKFYRATTDEVSFSIPPREYELAGRLLAEAVARAENERVPVSSTLRDAARGFGRSVGQRAQERAGNRANRERLLKAVVTELTECGYEPRRDGEGITLANCPFHALAQQYQDLVCGMNMELMEGFTETMDSGGLEARLEPQVGRCCVRLVRRADVSPS